MEAVEANGTAATTTATTVIKKKRKAHTMKRSGTWR